MSTSDILQWVVSTIMALALLYLSFRKAPSERASSDANAVKAYGEAAAMKGKENLRLEAIIENLEARLKIVERKRYQVTVEFEIGDPPVVGEVKIIPVVPPEEAPTKVIYPRK